MMVIFGGLKNMHYVFLASWKFALFFFPLLRKETTELLSKNRFPLTLLLISEN